MFEVNTLVFSFFERVLIIVFISSFFILLLSIVTRNYIVRSCKLVVIIIKIVEEIARRIINSISESIFLNIVKVFCFCIYI